MNEYFVYALIDPRDGSIFYIGKGKGNRPKQHLTESLRYKNNTEYISKGPPKSNPAGFYITRQYGVYKTRRYCYIELLGTARHISTGIYKESYYGA